MRICSIVGARPQFVKLAVICRAFARLGNRKGWTHRIIHTGQHYDSSLSDVFFEELDIPKPDHHLGVGSGAHGEQTGEMLKRLEPLLSETKPDWVLLYGDTNSTLAGALVAAKLGIPIAHVESGLRSFRRAMPEEINRVVTDHLSDLLFCPTVTAVENLRKEGLEGRARLTGDVMHDAALAYRSIAEARGCALADSCRRGEFALATVHRAENTDDPKKLISIIQALDQVAQTICPVVWPLHPRTRKHIDEWGCSPASVQLISPVSYFDMLLLEGRARFILTDSGGVQKEAYFFNVPCITLREETEWQETLENRCNVLVGCCESAILEAATTIHLAGPWVPVFGDGDAASVMLHALERR